MKPSPARLILTKDDLFLGERSAKTEAALARFTLVEVGPHDTEAFYEAYHQLYFEFGLRGELERREVLAAALARSAKPPSPPLFMRYHLLMARDVDGRLAGVRDCYVTFPFPLYDASMPLCVVYLAHSLVLPPFRRSGLASLLRAAPVTLARRDLRELGVDPSSAHLLLAAEMEPIDPSDKNTVIRLLAYGRSGFSVIAPDYLPYCQPDFRDLEALDIPAQTIPLLAVVRWLGNEDQRMLPTSFAAAFVERLYSVFSTHCRPEDLKVPREHALQTLASKQCELVPLIELPTQIDELKAFTPLLEVSALQHYPPALVGFTLPTPLEQTRELESLLASMVGGMRYRV